MVNYADILVVLTFFSVLVIKSVIIKVCLKKSFKKDFFRLENVIAMMSFLIVFFLIKYFIR